MRKSSAGIERLQARGFQTIMRRYIIEFGIGIDFHGQDVNRAAQKAVKDAIAKSCLCGLEEIAGIENLDEDLAIAATVCVTRPEAVVPEDIAACLPVGRTTVKAVAGGLRMPGLFLERFGDRDDSIEVAIAAIEVWV